MALLAIVSPAQGQWYLESTIDTSGLDFGGSSMSFAINGDTVVVGGTRDAYFFERTAGQWNQTKTLNLLRSGEIYMPVQVAMDGDNVAIGSYDSPTSYVLHHDAPGTWSSSSLNGRAFDIDISGDTVLLCYKGDWGDYGQRIFDRQPDGCWALSAILPAEHGLRRPH